MGTFSRTVPSPGTLKHQGVDFNASLKREALTEGRCHGLQSISLSVFSSKVCHPCKNGLVTPLPRDYGGWRDTYPPAKVCTYFSCTHAGLLSEHSALPCIRLQVHTCLSCPLYVLCARLGGPCVRHAHLKQAEPLRGGLCAREDVLPSTGVSPASRKEKEIPQRRKQKAVRKGAFLVCVWCSMLQDLSTSCLSATPRTHTCTRPCLTPITFLLASVSSIFVCEDDLDFHGYLCK